jgi:hypothetical protein
MSPRATCPPDVLGLLPWYAESTSLSDAERARVEAHAAGCDACRRELAWVDGTGQPGPPFPDRERIWARVQARIAQGERARAPLRRGLRRRAAPLAAGVAVALAFAAGLWAGSARRPRPDAGAEYRVASEPHTAPRAAAELDVVFQPGASAARIGSVLRALGAEIVSGPSPVSGVCRVRLAPGSDLQRAAEQLRSEVASFAEPLAE